MGFRFRLDTLLRMREIAEQREERLLGQISGQIVQSRQTLLDLDLQRRNLIARRDNSLLQSVSAHEINGYYAHMRQIEALEVSGRDQLAKLATLRDHQMKIYEAAHRQRELLSGMKGDQLGAFRKEEDRKEQDSVDDLFSSRRKLS